MNTMLRNKIVSALSRKVIIPPRFAWDWGQFIKAANGKVRFKFTLTAYFSGDPVHKTIEGIYNIKTDSVSAKSIKQPYSNYFTIPSLGGYDPHWNAHQRLEYDDRISEGYTEEEARNFAASRALYGRKLNGSRVVWKKDGYTLSEKQTPYGYCTLTLRKGSRIIGMIDTPRGKGEAPNDFWVNFGSRSGEYMAFNVKTLDAAVAKLINRELR